MSTKRGREDDEAAGPPSAVAAATRACASCGRALKPNNIRKHEAACARAAEVALARAQEALPNLHCAHCRGRSSTACACSLGCAKGAEAVCGAPRPPQPPKPPPTANQLAAAAKRRAFYARERAWREELERREREELEALKRRERERAAIARAAAVAELRAAEWDGAERARLALQAARKRERASKLSLESAEVTLHWRERSVSDLERQLRNAKADVGAARDAVKRAEESALEASRAVEAGAKSFAAVEAAAVAAGGGAEAAYSRRGERFIDVLPIVAAVGYAVDVSRCRFLCGTTFRKGDKGATNDMMVRALHLQAPWAAEVRRVRKEPVFVPCRARYIMAGPLAAALLTNNLRRVLQLLALGAPLAALSTEGRSPLHTAVWVGNPECLEAVLECICSGESDTRRLLDQRDARGWTPLALTLSKRWTWAARLLLDRNADEQLAPPGSTVLHEALRSDFGGPERDERIVTMLRHHSRPGFVAMLSVKDRDGRTPVEFARAKGKTAAVLALLVA